jgi:hypothetical protein
MANLFLLKISAHFDIVIDDYMKQKINENPMFAPGLINA